MKTEAPELPYLIYPVHLLPARNMKGKVPADMCAHQILQIHKQFTVQCLRDFTDPRCSSSVSSNQQNAEATYRSSYAVYLPRHEMSQHTNTTKT